MGQTLENGVYLPSEGERNCYAGLKTNWEILDQKVADVTALQQAVAGALHREIVESLPTTDIDPNTIYMILSGTSATENVYNEFMYVNNAWELIGTSATDLTNYYTKSEVDGKLLLKANASDLTSHTGDTTIHVTASDKAKWNNQTYVFRYSSTALVASSTNSNTLLDNTDNLKVGDKVIDSVGVLFSITAIDTANSTFTIGTALIDLAQDSDVVHKSGNETVGGEKTFTDVLTASRDITNGTIYLQNASYDPKTNGQAGVSTKSFSVNFVTALSDTFGAVSCYGANNRTLLRFTSRYFVDSQNVVEDSVEYTVYSDGTRSFKPRNNNNCLLGESTRKWKEVYATNYYYGLNNVEFSTKFVTTDTAQTVSGQKLFSDINAISSSAEIGVSAGNNSFKVLDKNKKIISRLEGGTYSSGMAYSTWLVNNGGDVFNGVSLYQPSANLAQLRPISSTLSLQLGSSSRSFSDCYTSKINGVEPSSLSLPRSKDSRIDISSYFTDTSNGAVNRYTAPANGFVYLAVADVVTIHIFSQGLGRITNYGDTRGRATAGLLYAFLPVRKDDIVASQWYTTLTNVSLTSAYFIPCQGNV